MSDQPDNKDMTRQEFLDLCGRSLLLLALGGGIGGLAVRKAGAGDVWQIDPSKCVECGKCATECVLDQSAVKCFHSAQICGYCDLCTGFFGAEPETLNEGAENQVCPAGAIKRSFVTDPYFQYEIDEARCIGCAKCVDGCRRYGNGSLYLQVRQDVCVNCNKCSIASACPANAFVRVPASKPYIPRPGSPA